MFLNKIRRLILPRFQREHLKTFKAISTWEIPKSTEFDTNYLCDTRNIPEIEENITNRKGVGNIKLVNELRNKLNSLEATDNEYEKTQDELFTELCKIPNRTHPEVVNYQEKPKVVREIGVQRQFDREIFQFHEIGKRLKLIRTEQLGHFCGSKSYYLLGELAELEQALIRYTTKKLLKNDFELVSVPDILHRNIIESCGMNTRGTRTQVYTLDDKFHGSDLCLSGTSEMALAAYLMNKEIPEKDLPLKLMAISRCYRAETSNIVEERGIYRVHEFTKVEMFVVSTPNKSEEELESIRKIQEDLFESLGLNFLVLDMPPHELGAPAYRKYDIEAWLHARKIYGEISSCSNCIDYQSRRLRIRYRNNEGSLDYVHTLNGTACAIPRLIIALIEQGQNSNGTVSIPEVLQPLMGGKAVIGKQKRIPELKMMKNKS